jgi:hypothetical protein
VNGTELPVVREGAFARAPIRLPYVGLRSASPIRTTLRIYAPDAQPGTSVRVELRQSLFPSGEPRASRVYVLDAPPQPTSLPIYPGFALVNLQDDFADVARVLDTANITVVPLPLDSGEIPRIWAFVTTTNNITQEVTLQQPQ